MIDLPMFDGSESQESFWRDQDGKKFIVDGIAYRLKVTAYDAIYPYNHRRLNVHAVPVNKRAKWYREQRAQLGDDFFTDVLASVDFELDILSQIALKEVA